MEYGSSRLLRRVVEGNTLDQDLAQIISVGEFRVVNGGLKTRPPGGTFQAQLSRLEPRARLNKGLPFTADDKFLVGFERHVFEFPRPRRKSASAFLLLSLFCRYLGPKRSYVCFSG